MDQFDSDIDYLFTIDMIPSMDLTDESNSMDGFVSSDSLEEDSVLAIPYWIEGSSAQHGAGLNANKMVNYDSTPTLQRDSRRRQLPGRVIQHEGMPIESLYNTTQDVQELGFGMAGKVYTVRHRSDGKKMACKVIDSNKVCLQSIVAEVKILQAVDHPNIVQCHNVFIDGPLVYIVMELCEGGDLFDHLVNRMDTSPDCLYTEGEIRTIIRQMIDAVRYLHSKGICHRDIKLENFMFAERGNINSLKLIDFGLSAHFSRASPMSGMVGTVYTIAPEVLCKDFYDQRCDVWSIGVLAFQLVTGFDPFHHENETQMKRKIIRADYHFRSKKWRSMTEEFKDFIVRSLQPCPCNRQSIEEAVEHEWLQAEYKDHWCQAFREFFSMV